MSDTSSPERRGRHVAWFLAVGAALLLGGMVLAIVYYVTVKAP